MLKIKFCKRDDCRAVAVGVSRWDRNLRPHEDHCRAHYISDVMGEPVLATVVGPALITDSITQEGVDFGGTVRLDPLQVNVAQLVYAGHVELIETKPAKPAKTPAAPKNDG